MRTARQRATDFAAYLVLRLLIATVQAMPLRMADGVCRGFAWLLGDAIGMRRRVVQENLRTAFPEWGDARRRECARQMWRHLFLMVAEVAHTPRKVHRTNWRERCDIPDIERTVHALMLDRPKVIISGHHGNFELGGYLLGLFGFPTHTVARPIDNPHVNRYINEFRGRTGQHILPKQGSRDAIEKILGGGGILTLLGDQAAGEKAVWTPFFGRPASTHKAVSLFSLGYEAPTMVMGARRLDKPLRYHLSMQGMVDPRAEGFELGTPTDLTRWFTEQLEAVIRQAPGQYWWVHRRWKGEPPARALRQMAKAAEEAAA